MLLEIDVLSSSAFQKATRRDTVGNRGVVVFVFRKASTKSNGVGDPDAVSIGKSPHVSYYCWSLKCCRPRLFRRKHVD